jgi:hypothetical protein
MRKDLNGVNAVAALQGGADLLYAVDSGIKQDNLDLAISARLVLQISDQALVVGDLRIDERNLVTYGARRNCCGIRSSLRLGGGCGAGRSVWGQQWPGSAQ